jgi:chromatin segregation and condensation protein Rec8/ScpA/Scc1 (kleisin family)
MLFLAMLELYKLGHVDLDQPDPRGDIMLARAPGETDLSVLAAPDGHAADAPAEG